MEFPRAWYSAGSRRLEDHLLSIEKEIGLLSSFSPTNFGAEVVRLGQELSRGQEAVPRFVYRKLPRSELQSVRIKEHLQAVDIALSSVSKAGAQGGEDVLGKLLSDRVLELSLEHRLVAARGTEDVVPLGRERYVFSQDELEAADALAEGWLSQKEGESAEDECELLSSRLSRLCSERGHSIRIVEREIASVAAIADDCLVVRRGALASAREAERLFVHEVEGHLLPRMRAESGPAPLRIGTRASVEDEEGRAILLEERSGTLGPRRRRWLAVRHLLARAVRGGQGGSDVALSLASEGAPAGLVASELCRTLRGGGLAREIVYLPGYVRVRSALEAHPEDEEWMLLGRVSTAVARELSLTRDRNR